MIVYAKNVRFLNDVCLEVLFQDGKIIQYDMSNLFEKYPQLEELRKNRILFELGHLDSAGCGIIWTDELDIDTMTIYEEGKLIGFAETTINQKIGIKLAQIREKKNITQSELAKLSHIDQGDISKIEKGLGNPTIGKIDKLFKALGKSIDITVK